MFTDRRAHRCRRAVLLVVVGLAVTVSGCASSAGSGAAKAAIESGCARVNAALSDGPDPNVDPVGYALAQIRPLRAIRTSDATLQAAIDKLASAYLSFYETSGSKAAKAKVDVASSRLDKMC